MDAKQAAQQIQALAANVEELTRQNEEIRRATESQNEERQWTAKNRNEEEGWRIEGSNNEEESDSQVNRRTRASEENSLKMESEPHNIGKEMVELKNEVKDRAVENLDGMIYRTDSPFTTEVLNHPLPPKFHLPQLESFDDSRDPLDNIESYKTLLFLQMTPDEVLCRAFPTTLKGVARVWFSKLPSTTIANFEQVNKGFVCHFIGRQRHKNLTRHLLNFC